MNLFFPLYMFLYADGDGLFNTDKNNPIKFCMCLTILYTKYGMTEIHVNIYL